MLGAEDLDGLRWPGVGTGAGRVPASALHAALPAPEFDGSGGLAVLSCDRSAHGPSPTAVSSVLDAGRRAGETVVCDVPRYPTEAAVAALEAADLTVLVVPADVRSCAAAARVAAVVAEHGGPSAGLVVRGPAPGGLAPDEVATALGLPLVAAMRAERGLARTLERGSAPGRARGPLADRRHVGAGRAAHSGGGAGVVTRSVDGRAARRAARAPATAARWTRCSSTGCALGSPPRAVSRRRPPSRPPSARRPAG